MGAGAGFWPSVLHFKGINRKEKRTRTKKKNLERGLNPSVGKARQEQDQQQQQENNKNKRKATTTRHKKLLKRNNIKSKRNKTRKEKRADYKTNETNKGTQLSHSFQNLKYFLHLNLFSLLKPPLCLFILILTHIKTK